MSRSPTYQAVVSFLRQAKLLETIDKLRYYRLRRSSLSSRNTFQHQYGKAALPPDDLAYDAYGFLNWEQYWTSGIETATLLSSILLREFSDQHPRRLLEWGCGPARIVRHIPEMLNASGNWCVFGTDYSSATVRWCRDNITGVVFSENGLEPPLPYGTMSLDAVYCISVFTHLSEAMQCAWAKELARVLREGGVLIASFHGDATRSHLIASEQRRYDCGQAVVRGHVAEGKRTFVAYHPPDFVRKLLSPEFEIVSQQTSPVPSLGLQDLYVAKKLSG
jgi:SAM-dependent methyltransferase